MNWILYIISILWIIFGSCAILYTTSTRRAFKSITEGLDLKIIAVLPALTGLLLLISASASHYPWFVRLIGLIAIIKGIGIALNPNKMVTGINDWFIRSATDQSYRFIGILFVILGTALLSWIG
jgi:uncharacterized protein YjeT (DUF2065 family)